MDELIRTIAVSSGATQALAVTVVGLAGVFATLTVFFLIIWIANRILPRP